MCKGATIHIKGIRALCALVGKASGKCPGPALLFSPEHCPPSLWLARLACLWLQALYIFPSLFPNQPKDLFPLHQEGCHNLYIWSCLFKNGDVEGRFPTRPPTTEPTLSQNYGHFLASLPALPLFCPSK